MRASELPPADQKAQRVQLQVRRQIMKGLPEPRCSSTTVVAVLVYPAPTATAKGGDVVGLDLQLQGVEPAYFNAQLLSNQTCSVAAPPGSRALECRRCQVPAPPRSRWRRQWSAGGEGLGEGGLGYAEPGAGVPSGAGVVGAVVPGGDVAQGCPGWTPE